jgi:hypothetical protein
MLVSTPTTALLLLAERRSIILTIVVYVTWANILSTVTRSTRTSGGRELRFYDTNIVVVLHTTDLNCVCLTDMVDMPLETREQPKLEGLQTIRRFQSQLRKNLLRKNLLRKNLLRKNLLRKWLKKDFRVMNVVLVICLPVRHGKIAISIDEATIILFLSQQLSLTVQVDPF